MSLDRIYYDLEQCKIKCKEILRDRQELSRKYRFNYIRLCEELCEIENTNFPPSELWLDYYDISDLSIFFEIKDKKRKIHF